MDDFVFSDFRTGLDRGLEDLAEMAGNMQGLAEAPTAAARSDPQSPGRIILQ